MAPPEDLQDDDLKAMEKDLASLRPAESIGVGHTTRVEGGGGGGGNTNSGDDNDDGEVPRHVTARGLKTRHAQMIALGGTLGTGLFVGAGTALEMGGPLFLLLAYLFISLLVYGVATATGEMSSYLPVPGASMSGYGDRFLSRSMGFALGWVYWYTFSITVPAEINATILVLQYWDIPVPPAALIVAISVVIILANCVPVSVYGEMEFWFATIKVLGVIGMLLMTVVLFFGGGPTGEALWFRNWTYESPPPPSTPTPTSGYHPHLLLRPGPTKPYIFPGNLGRLVAIISATAFSIYAFAYAPELLVVAGGEMRSPRRTMPRATKRYIYRLLVFYVLGALAIGVLTPSGDPGLLSPDSSDSSSDASASPWALGARRAGLPALGSVINAVIVVAAMSAANSYFYLATRCLYSLASDGNAPSLFRRCTRRGVPHWAALSTALWCLLTYLNVAAGSGQVFTFMVNLLNCGAFNSWICCILIYARFRKAVAAQGRVAHLPYRSRFQPWLGYFSAAALTLLLLLSGMKVFFAGHWDTGTFVTSYVGIPIFFLLYFGHRFTVGRHDPWVIPPLQVDLTTGLDEIRAHEEMEPPPKDEKWYMKWKAIFG